MANRTSTAQKAACIRLERNTHHVGTPRFVTAEALVRRGYATWFMRSVGTVKLTNAGLSLARDGITLD